MARSYRLDAAINALQVSQLNQANEPLLILQTRATVLWSIFHPHNEIVFETVIFEVEFVWGWQTLMYPLVDRSLIEAKLVCR
jgi:hypothetical protein